MCPSLCTWEASLGAGEGSAWRTRPFGLTSRSPSSTRCPFPPKSVLLPRTEKSPGPPGPQQGSPSEETSRRFKGAKRAKGTFLWKCHCPKKRFPKCSVRDRFGGVWGALATRAPSSCPRHLQKSNPNDITGSGGRVQQQTKMDTCFPGKNDLGVPEGCKQGAWGIPGKESGPSPPLSLLFQ